MICYFLLFSHAAGSFGTFRSREGVCDLERAAARAWRDRRRLIGRNRSLTGGGSRGKGQGFRGEEQTAALQADTQHTLPRKRRKDGPVHRRVLSVRGAYRLAQKRSLGLGGGVLKSLCSRGADGPTCRRGGGLQVARSVRDSERGCRFCRMGDGSAGG